MEKFKKILAIIIIAIGVISLYTITTLIVGFWPLFIAVCIIGYAVAFMWAIGYLEYNGIC